MKNQLDKNNFVYSTNPNFEFEIENDVVETLSTNKQMLRVILDTKMRAGKKVTLISGSVSYTHLDVYKRQINALSKIQFWSWC